MRGDAPDNHRKSKSNSAITIREIELEDLPEVYALGEHLFTSENWPNLYRTWDDYELVEMFATDRETCLVAERDDHILGFVLGTVIEKRRSAWTYGYIVWLCVSPDAGRSGVGTKLVERVTELFIERGARMIITDTDAENGPAIAFFERQGFSNKRKHIYFAKNLARHPAYLRLRKSKRTFKRPGGKNLTHGNHDGITMRASGTAGRHHEREST